MVIDLAMQIKDEIKHLITKNVELQAKVDELTAERDKIQRERNVAISRASYMESAAAEELAKLLEENDTIEVYDDKIHGKRRLVTGTQRKLEKQVAELTAELEARDKYPDGFVPHSEMMERVGELTEQLEAAQAKNRALKAHISKMQAGRHGWHVKGVELQRQVGELTTQLHASNAERARLRECLGIATDNAHDLLTLVDESGNVYDRDEGLA